MAKDSTEGQSRGIKLRDENGDGYGIKHTGNAPHVVVTSSVIPSGAASSEKQDEAKVVLNSIEVNQDVLYSLVETIQELNARLLPLASAMESGNTRLRVVQTAVPSTAVTGPLTDAQNTAANLVMLKNSDIYGGDKAIQSNINNVIFE